MSFQVFAAIAAAGSVGAVLRFLLVQLLQSWPGAPWATAAVNVAGCFGFGLCWALAQERWSPLLTAAVLAGFFGAFTTFSSFAFDCQQLLAERRYAALFGNAVLQNGLGFAALLGGIAVAGWWRD